MTMAGAVMGMGVAMLIASPAGAQCREFTRIVSLSGADEDFFGRAVSKSADCIIIGAPGYDFSSLDPLSGVLKTKEDIGTAYVYRYDSSTSSWVEESMLMDVNPGIVLISLM